MTTPLTLSTQADYNPSGTPEIYSSESPFVRNADIILPGVDLTAIPIVGRGMLIAPDVVARAWHNRGSIGQSYTFVEQDGTTHQRTQIDFSDQLGGDLVLARLDSPLPPAIRPMRIVPGNLEQYSEGERLWSYRVTYNGGHRLSLGDFDPSLSGARRLFYVQEEIPATNGHWREAISGDSGGANFVVINGEPFAIAGTTNTAEVGTAIDCFECGVIRSAVFKFAPDVTTAQLWPTDLNPEGRPTIPTPDKSTIFIRPPRT